MTLGGSDVDRAIHDTRQAALVRCDAGRNQRDVSRGDRQASGQGRHGLRHSAVIPQRREEDGERIAVGPLPVGTGPAGAVVGPSDHVVSLGSEVTVDVVGPAAVGVPGDDRVGDVQRGALGANASVGIGGVAADGAVVERCRGTVLIEEAAIVVGVVAADGGV